MSNAEIVLVDVAGGVGRVTLNRPEAMNAITVELATALERALRALGEREDVRVILLAGTGGNFSAGGDVHEVGRLREQGPAAVENLLAGFAAACRAVSEVAQPVVAAVEGVAMAGGFELMQAADIVLVHEDARLRDTHIVHGQVPAGGGSQRLPRRVGHQRAMGHLLSGDVLTPGEAVAWGLAYRVLAADGFAEAVETFVGALAARRPDAVRTIKRLVRDGLAGPLADGLDLELRAAVAHLRGAGGDAGVRSFADRTRT